MTLGFPEFITIAAAFKVAKDTKKEALFQHATMVFIGLGLLFATLTAVLAPGLHKQAFESMNFEQQFYVEALTVGLSLLETALIVYGVTALFWFFKKKS
jgi:hypothetical protein